MKFTTKNKPSDSEVVLWKEPKPVEKDKFGFLSNNATSQTAAWGHEKTPVKWKYQIQRGTK